MHTARSALFLEINQKEALIDSERRELDEYVKTRKEFVRKAYNKLDKLTKEQLRRRMEDIQDSKEQ